jgi:hypothetical protein
VPRSREALVAEVAYRQALDEIQIEIGRQLATLTMRIDRDRLAAEIESLLPTLASLVAAGQQQAQTAASSFLASFLAAETRSSPRPLAIGSEIAGANSEGAPLLPLLAASLGRSLFSQLQNGRSVDDALSGATRGLVRMATGEIVAAADSELQRQGERRRGVSGWVWVPVGLTCGACLSYGSGETRPWSERPPRHPRCNCIVSVVMDDDPGTIRRPTGDELFRAASREQQIQMFRTAGETKAELVHSGRVTLRELMDVEQHASWRDTITERPLAAVLP